MKDINTDRRVGWFVRCEECGEIVEGCVTNNGVGWVGHYVHCGWGHECNPEDLKQTKEEVE